MITKDGLLAKELTAETRNLSSFPPLDSMHLNDYNRHWLESVLHKAVITFFPFYGLFLFPFVCISAVNAVW